MTIKQHQNSPIKSVYISPIFSISLLSIISLLSACHTPPPSMTQVVDERGCNLDENTDGCRELVPTPAHSPECIAVDDELCLISFNWVDGAPRLGALTPGEPFTINEVSIFNAGTDPIKLIELSSLVSTADLEVVEGELNLTEIMGVAWRTVDMPLSEEELVQVNADCQTGELAPQRGCTFSIGLSLQVKESAPINAAQRLELAADSQRGSRFEWDLPLLIVDGIDGLSIGEITIEDSTQDGQVHLGDRLRITQIELLNATFSPFTSVQALLSYTEGDVSVMSDLVTWDDVSLDGLLNDTIINCPAASTIDGVVQPGRCQLRFSEVLSVNPQRDSDTALVFTLSLKDQGLTLPNRFEVTFDIHPWMPTLKLLPIELTSDDNRDRLASSGERIGINQLRIENQSDSAISLRGRVMVNSDLASLRSSSDLSVNETMLRDDFFEACPAQTSCPIDVNILAEISDLSEPGQMIPITLEAMDQTGLVHFLESELEVTLPDVRLELAEFEVRQDTLDLDLSAGERGVISYLKVINEGLADATDLEVTITSDSDYITFEETERLTFTLNTSSSTIDERSGNCPSTTLEPDGYCYRRTDLFFTVSEEAPLGEIVDFNIEITDSRGTTYLLDYSLTLF